MHDVLRPLELSLRCLAGVLTERERVKNLYLREENRIPSCPKTHPLTHAASR